jgi:hypothetical protein
MVMGFTTRKKKFYEEKCQLIRSYLDKLFYYMEKAREDGIITTDEIQGFRRIIEEYYQRKGSIYEPQMKYLESKDFIKIQKAAKTEAKKELQENLKNQKKEELLL